MKAVLMAGGEGRRMRPLTSTVPKPLLPVVDRPLMTHSIELLARHGITDIVVTVQYLASQIRDYFDDGSDYGVTLTYATETQPLGTAGGVAMARSLLDSDEPFLVLSADTLTDTDLSALIEAHMSDEARLTMTLARREDPREFGMAVLSESGHVQQLKEKPTWAEVVSDRVNTGIYCVDPEVLDLIPSDGPSDWAQDIIPILLREPGNVAGFLSERYWEDVGSLATYLSVQRDVMLGTVRSGIRAFEVDENVWVAEGAEVAGDVELNGPMYLGPFARLEAGAVVGPDSVLGANVVVGRGARIEQSMVMGGSWVDRGCELRGAIIGRGVQVLHDVRVNDGAVIGDECVLGEESSVSANVHVYPSKSVEAGAQLQDSLVWESRGRKHILGSHGVSGLINIEVTPEVVVRIASALAAILNRGTTVTVGRDHSRAARAFNRAAIGALTAGGLQVRDLRTAPVPVVRADTANSSSGGIVFVTSPGKPESLEMRLLDADGFDIPSKALRSLELAYLRREFRRPTAPEIGDVVVPHRVVEDYANDIVASVNTQGIVEADLRVVLDCSNGTASPLIPTLLSRLPIQLLTINNRVDDTQTTESAAQRGEAMSELAGLVATSDADFGVRVDPSGQRLHLVDDNGQVIADDRAALIVADLIAAELNGGRVALPVTTTRLAEQVIGFHGAAVLWTPPDEAILSQAAAQPDVVLAADGRGGFIIPPMGRHLDPFAAFIRLLGLIARTRLRLSEINARIPRSFVEQEAVPTAWGRRAQVMRTVTETAQGSAVRIQQMVNGIMLDLGPRSWAFIQPDAGQPLTHITVEGPDRQTMESLLSEWSAVIRGGLA